MLALEQSDAVMVAYNLEDHSQLPVIEKANELKKNIFIKKVFASGHRCSPEETQKLFNEILAYPSVSSVVIGTINPAHLKQNVALVKK